MKFTLKLGIIAGWLWGSAVWSQITEPGDDKQAVRRQIAWLISEQFGLDRERSAKLDMDLSAELIPLREEAAVISWGESIPVWILDKVVISRNGVLALVDVLSREQLEVLFVSRLIPALAHATRALGQWEALGHFFPETLENQGFCTEIRGDSSGFAL